MTRFTSSFFRERELIFVEAKIVGPRRAKTARLVLDTGAAATTLTPNLIEDAGYSHRDFYRKARVRTAIGEEEGHWLRVTEIAVLGIETPNFALHVFNLKQDDIDGLLGMNFLRHFNLEIRPIEQLIVVERVRPARAGG